MRAPPANGRLFHQQGWGERLGAFGKRIAPLFARLAARRPGPFAYASMYLDLVQGKGAGAGWDLDSEVAVALRFIRRPAPVVFDAGAHEGAWTRAFLRACPGARITQFEPAPSNLAVLRRAPSPAVELVAAAVSDRAGELDFHAASTSDLGSLHPRRESVFADRQYDVVRVAAVTLDDVIERQGVERVDFLKMDIEGHELAALQGASRSLADGKIRALSFEFGSGNVNSRTFFHDFWDLLTPLGYRLHRVCPGGHLLPIRRYYEDLEHFRNVSNYVAALEAPRGR